MKSVALTLAVLFGTMTCGFANSNPADAPKEEKVSLEQTETEAEAEAEAPKAN